MLLVEVYLQLRRRYPEARFISERQLLRDKFADGVGKHGHVSDGMLIFPDNKQIAIEVELSLKGKNRLERIFKGYGKQHLIKEVWYYCRPDLMASLNASAVKMLFIKIYNPNDFLNER